MWPVGVVEIGNAFSSKLQVLLLIMSNWYMSSPEKQLNYCGVGDGNKAGEK